MDFFAELDNFVLNDHSCDGYDLGWEGDVTILFGGLIIFTVVHYHSIVVIQIDYLFVVDLFRLNYLLPVLSEDGRIHREKNHRGRHVKWSKSGALPTETGTGSTFKILEPDRSVNRGLRRRPNQSVLFSANRPNKNPFPKLSVPVQTRNSCDGKNASSHCEKSSNLYTDGIRMVFYRIAIKIVQNRIKKSSRSKSLRICGTRPDRTLDRFDLPVDLSTIPM